MSNCLARRRTINDMATTRSISRPPARSPRKPATTTSTVAEQSVVEQTTAPTETTDDAPATEPRLRAVKAKMPAPAQPAPPDSPAALQRRAAKGGEGEDKLNVRLLIDGSDADGIRAYDEQLPVSLVRAILDPQVADFFIPIQGNGRMKPAITKSHWLHTSYIREVLVFGELSLEG